MTNIMVTPAVQSAITQTDKENSTITTVGLENQGDWHEGTNTSTPEVNIAYQQHFGEGELTQRMEITYNDKTDTWLAFDISSMFEPGGVDVPSQQVLNWSKAYYSTVGLSLASHSNDTYVATGHVIDGFSMYEGNASELELELFEEHPWCWQIKNEDLVTEMSFLNSTTKIGELNINARDYIYDGRNLKESIITFNVTINASIWDSSTTAKIPVVLMYRITHNITATTYKYGAVIDWSQHKDFPCGGKLATGDQFSLVAADRFSIGACLEREGFTCLQDVQVSNFTTDTANDSAIFRINGIELGSEKFPTQYLINGTEPHDTTRIYIYNSSYTPDIYISDVTSRMFIIFDGFKYNQSTGFRFDPYVIVPCSETSDNIGIPWNGLLINLIGLTALITVVYGLIKSKNKRELNL